MSFDFSVTMCDCPTDLVNIIVCGDGTFLTLPLDDYVDTETLAERHADTVAAHGGVVSYTICCPECERVYFKAETQR